MKTTNAFSIRALALIAPTMILAATAVYAHEPPAGLLAHLPFDGSLADATGNGFTAEMAGADASAPPSPQYVEGRFGRALALDGERSVRLPIDLHYDNYPEVTITGCVFLECDAPVSPGSPDQGLNAAIAPATIGGLAVCSNDRANQRVKGIELRGNVVRPDGSIGSYGQDAEELANCRQWEPVVLCPVDYVATGIVAHFNDRRGASELVGMQLICRRVVTG